MDYPNGSPSSTAKSQSFYFMFFLKWLGTAQSVEHYTQQELAFKAKFQIIKGHQVINSIKEPIPFDLKEGWSKGQKVQISFFLKDYSPYREVQFVVKVNKKTENSQQTLGEIKIKANKYIQAFVNEQVNKIQEHGEFGRYNASFLIFTQKSRHTLQKIVKMYKNSQQNYYESIQKQIEVIRSRKIQEQKQKQIQKQVKQVKQINVQQNIVQNIVQNQVIHQQDKRIQQNDAGNMQNNVEQSLQLNKQVYQQNKQQQIHQIQQPNMQIVQNVQDRQDVQNNEEVIDEVQQKQQIIIYDQQQPQLEQNVYEQQQPKDYQIHVIQVKDEQELKPNQDILQPVYQKQMQQPPQEKKQQIQEQKVLNSVQQKTNQKTIQTQIQKNQQQINLTTKQQIKQAVYQTPKKQSSQKNDQSHKTSPKTVQSFKVLSQQPKQSKARHVTRVQEPQQSEGKSSGMRLSFKIIILLLIFGVVGSVGYYLFNMNKLVDETITHHTIKSKKKSTHKPTKPQVSKKKVPQKNKSKK